MDGYAFSSCDLARLAEVDGLRSDADDDTALPSEERIRQSIIQVPLPPACRPLSARRAPRAQPVRGACPPAPARAPSLRDAC